MKRLLVAAVIAVTASFAVAGASAAPPSFKLHPSAGNYSPKFDFAKQTGNGTFSQAQWTNTQAHTGRFSVLLQKSVDYFSCYTLTPVDGCASFAAVLIKGVEGQPLDSNPIGYWFKGDCLGGSPRINILWDNDGDGQWDGYGFYADCTTGAAPDANGWREVTGNTNAPIVTVGAPALPGATIVQAYVIVDNKQTTYVDDVTFGSTTVGEPNGS